MLSIRLLQQVDLVQIADLERENFSHPWDEASLAWSINNTSYGLLDGAVLVGYIFTICVLDECMITNVCIGKQQQRQGLGYRLTSEVLSRLQEDGMRSFHLEVRQSNLPAQRLYRRLGFQEVGVRKLYYSQPDEDAILMAMFIGSEQE